MNIEKPKIEKLLKPLDVCRILGVTDRTLANWRKKKINLNYYKLTPRIVRYERAEIDRFIERNTVKP